MSDAPQDKKTEAPGKPEPAVLRYGFATPTLGKEGDAQALAWAERKAKAWRDIRKFAKCEVLVVRRLSPGEGMKGFHGSTHIVVLGDKSAFGGQQATKEAADSDKDEDDDEADAPKTHTTPSPPSAKTGGRGKK